MNTRPLLMFAALVVITPIAIIRSEQQANSQGIVYHFPGCQMHAEDFDAKRSVIPQAEMVQSYFSALDDVTETTDGALAAFFNKQNVEVAYAEYVKGYDAAVGKVKQFQFPAELKPAADLILAAIVEQRQFFDAWHEALKSGKEFSNPPLQNSIAYSSSAKLHQAYGHLYLTYKNEHQCNLEAFSDHLCSLDLL